MALIDLRKKVGIVLTKRNVSADIMAQVGVAFDITGSMQQLYTEGTMQTLAERLLAVALRFDDNGNLDAWSFCTSSDELPGVTERNYSNYVFESLINNPKIDKWGSTNFAPVLNNVKKFYFGSMQNRPKMIEKEADGFFGKLFGKKKEVMVRETVNVPGQNDGKMPVYLMFVTDGDCFDSTEAEYVLESLKDKNIYIEFIGVGVGATFKFCQVAAIKYQNVGFVQFKDLQATSDDQLYEGLLDDKFCNWLKK